MSPPASFETWKCEKCGEDAPGIAVSHSLPMSALAEWNAVANDWVLNPKSCKIPDQTRPRLGHPKGLELMRRCAACSTVFCCGCLIDAKSRQSCPECGKRLGRGQVLLYFRGLDDCATPTPVLRSLRAELLAEGWSRLDWLIFLILVLVLGGLADAAYGRPLLRPITIGSLVTMAVVVGMASGLTRVVGSLSWAKLFPGWYKWKCSECNYCLTQGMVTKKSRYKFVNCMGCGLAFKRSSSSGRKNRNSMHVRKKMH